jgi:hypothetical protein
VLRTGKDYIESLRDGREVWIDGEQVTDVATHPAFAPIVSVRARIYDLAHEAGTAGLLTYTDDETAERCATTSRPPRTREDWRAKRDTVDAILDDAGGVVTRVGDETVGEMWSLFDGQNVLNEIDPAFSANIARHVRRAQLLDPFHVSANTDPKGNRALRPQDQDPDVLLHVAGETGNGIVVRGAKFETAAAYANQAFVKPTIGEWNNEVLSDYAVGFLADMGAPGIKHICRSAFAGQRSPEDYPLTSRYDEIDTMIVFDDGDPLGERLLLPAHQGGRVHPRDPAPVQHLPVRPALPAVRRFPPRRRLRQRPVHRRHHAPGRAGEDRADRVLPGGRQRAPDRGDRAGRAQPGRAADAQSADDVRGPGIRLLPAAGGHAPRPRPVRLPGQPDAQQGHVRLPRGWRLAAEIFHHRRDPRGGTAQALRAGP